MIVLFATSAAADMTTNQALDSIRSNGLLLIEKEMIRLSDVPKRTWKIEEQKAYRSLLFLEEYYISRGISSWSMKVLHSLISMRDNTPDLKKKAFLECEAWRVLDYDLKNNEKIDLIRSIMDKRKFSNEDHMRFRKFTSDKVSSCVSFISTQWTWLGRDYTDLLYDIKAKNALDAVKSYVKMRSVSSSP